MRWIPHRDAAVRSMRASYCSGPLCKIFVRLLFKIKGGRGRKKTMIKRALILTIFLFTYLFGHEADPFFSAYAFERIEKNTVDDSIKKLIEPKSGDLKKYLYNLDSTSTLYSSEIIGRDIIYSGRWNGEGQITRLWNINSREIKNFGYFFGVITGIYKSETTYLSVFEKGCCASEVDWYVLYKIDSDTIIEEDRIKIFMNTSFPKSRINIAKVLMKNKGYSLRASPIIDNTPDTILVDSLYIQRGNVIAELTKGSILLPTSKHTDTENRKWWFVIVEKKFTTGYDIISSWGKPETKICGWISRKYLTYDEIQ